MSAGSGGGSGIVSAGGGGGGGGSFSSTTVAIKWITPDVRELRIKGGTWRRWPGEPWRRFYRDSRHFGATS